uniref:Translational regulator CsrA n=1 Tax=Desulfobacca acetoxidans TaxID=60893 RepID=A0A7C3SLP7_9BACT
MLILTRKLGEGLFIGDDIRVTVIEIRGRQIRLGIEAPSHIVVLREEVYRRVQEENLKAAAVEGNDFERILRLWGKQSRHDSESSENSG